MVGARFALVAAVSAVVLGLSASASAAGTSTSSGTVTSGSAGAYGAAHCLAHVVGGLSETAYDYYTPGCTGHDEPELDPVSSAPGSAQNITWRAVLPADGTFPVSSVGPTFWFGGTVKDTNPHKIGGQGFLELQFYPDSLTTRCTPTAASSSSTRPTYTRRAHLSGRSRSRRARIIEPAAFNGMLMDAAGSGPFVMHARDIVDVHIWAPSPDAAYREQVTDETSGQTSSVLVLNSPGDGPLTPAFSTQRDRQRARLGRRLGHADGLRVRDRPLGPLRPPSRHVLRPGPDLLRLVQRRQLGRPAADPDPQRHLR